MQERLSRLNEMFRKQKENEAIASEGIRNFQEQIAERRRIDERRENNRFWLNFWLSVAAFIVALLSLVISLRK